MAGTDRNSAIDKAIQPMLQMLEQRSAARQQATAAQSEQQKADLLEQLLPVQMQASGKDYQEARQAEKVKATQAGQKGTKQPAAVPKVMPMSTAQDPAAGLGTDAAARLNALVAGGPQPAAMGADRTGASGVQGQGAPDMQGQPQGGQGFETPGQTVRTQQGSTEPFLKQILRGQLGVPQQRGPIQDQTTPTVLEFSNRGAVLMEPSLIKDEKADPMQDPEVKSYKARLEKRLGPEMTQTILSESLGRAQRSAEQERRKRTVEDAGVAQGMFEEGYSKDEVDMAMEGRRVGSMALITKARSSRVPLSTLSAQADLENRQLGNRAMEMKLDMLNSTQAKRTFFGWVNPENPYGGPGGAGDRREAILMGAGASSDASAKTLRDQAWTSWRERRSMVSRDQVSTSVFMKEFYTDWLAANELDLNDKGRVTLINHDMVASGEENPTATVMDVPELTGDIMTAYAAVLVGGLTLAEYAETAPGQKLQAKLVQYGLDMDPNDLTLSADRTNPVIKAQDGTMGEGMAPLMDQIGLGISRIAEYSVMTGQDGRDLTVDWTNTPIKQWDTMMTREFWQEYYARGKAGDTAAAEEVATKEEGGWFTKLFGGGEQAPTGGTPTAARATTPQEVGGVPVGDLNISADELATGQAASAKEAGQIIRSVADLVGRGPGAAGNLDEKVGKLVAKVAKKGVEDMGLSKEDQAFLKKLTTYNKAADLEEIEKWKALVEGLRGN